MCNCCCWSFLTISGGLGYYLYNVNISTLFDDIDRLLVGHQEKKIIELEPLNPKQDFSSNEETISQPHKNEYVFL